MLDGTVVPKKKSDLMACIKSDHLDFAEEAITHDERLEDRCRNRSSVIVGVESKS